AHRCDLICDGGGGDAGVECGGDGEGRLPATGRTGADAPRRTGRAASQISDHRGPCHLPAARSALPRAGDRAGGGSVELTVVGCAGSSPSADSACSSYLIVHDGFRLVIDLGFGALGALQRYVHPSEVDVVLISHLHLDHCVDMCAYYVVRRYDPDGPLP